MSCRVDGKFGFVLFTEFANRVGWFVIISLQGNRVAEGGEEEERGERTDESVNFLCNYC